MTYGKSLQLLVMASLLFHASSQSVQDLIDMIIASNECASLTAGNALPIAPRKCGLTRCSYPSQFCVKKEATSSNAFSLAALASGTECRPVSRDCQERLDELFGTTTPEPETDPPRTTTTTARPRRTSPRDTSNRQTNSNNNSNRQTNANRQTSTRTGHNNPRAPKRTGAQSSSSAGAQNNTGGRRTLARTNASNRGVVRRDPKPCSDGCCDTFYMCAAQKKNCGVKKFVDDRCKKTCGTC